MADFQIVLKEFKRMCCSIGSCINCPLWEAHKGNVVCRTWTFANPEVAEKIIMQWSDEHPVMTNRRKFEEVFGFDMALFGIAFDDNSCTAKWLREEYKEKNANE